MPANAASLHLHTAFLPTAKFSGVVMREPEARSPSGDKDTTEQALAETVAAANVGTELTLSADSSDSAASADAAQSAIGARGAASEREVSGVSVSARSSDLRTNPDALIGEVLDERYQIVRLLGRGGMGAVYLARHLSLDAEYAIKVLLVARDPEGQRRFVTEARLASRVRHPNTVFISDFGVARNGLLYLAMEHIPGRSLAEEVRRRGRIEPTEALRIAAEVARGLQAVHDCGIVHRDMKPENVPTE